MTLKEAKYNAVWSEDEIACLCSSESHKFKNMIIFNNSLIVYTPIIFGPEVPCKKFGLFKFLSGTEKAIPGCRLVFLTFEPVEAAQVKKAIQDFKLSMKKEGLMK